MRWVQWTFDHLPPWLIPAFVYASALSIVASASHKNLYNCLMVSEWQTWGIFLSGVLAGLAWQNLCQHLARQPRLPIKAAALARSLSGTSLVVGAGTAWLLYEYSSLRYASAGMCSRLGVLDLYLQPFFQRMALLTEQQLHLVPLPALLTAVAWGLFVGLIVLIESRTAVTALAELLRQTQHHAQAETLHTPLMRWNAGCQALLTPATTIASSVSQARSQMIWSLYQPSAMAVLLISVVTGQTLLGFVIPAIWSIGMHWWRMRKTPCPS